ncbi:hypothetical protein ACROYT_G035721 [Oculina patagonica]
MAGLDTQLYDVSLLNKSSHAIENGALRTSASLRVSTQGKFYKISVKTVASFADDSTKRISKYSSDDESMVNSAVCSRVYTL